MPQRSVVAYLQDIRDACNAIRDTIGGLELDTYKRVRQLRSAVEREFTLIGGALRQALRLDRSLGETITAASTIISFRNHPVHGYHSISDDVVWGIIQSHLPRLLDEINDLLKERDHP